MTDDTRAEFERWARARFPDIDYAEWGFDPYEWAAWQAAIAHERTRCAAIARAHGAEDVAAEIEHSN